MTADVKIHRNPKGGWACLLNGEDVANDLIQTGVKVEFTEYNMALVTLTFHAYVDLDLPEAEVLRVRQ
jgi:hypothetical protein